MAKMKFWNGTAWVTLDARDADTVDGKHAADFAPINHIGTGGTAHALATINVAGFMSGPDKEKLDNIQEAAEVNQSAYSNIRVGATTMTASNPTDTFELVAGSNVTLTPDAVNDRIIISSVGTTGSSGEMNQNAFSSVRVGATQMDADNTMDILNIAAGTNISLSADTATDTLTIATTAQPNQNAFSTVKIGSTLLQADAPSDTLELIAGANISLVGNASSDTLTIALTGKVGDADTVDGKHASELALASDLASLTADYNVHTTNYSSYGSGKDGDVYTVIDYKRPDGTLYMKSTLSNKNVDGHYGRDTWRYYNAAGTTVLETVIWGLTYDADGNIISKVVQ